MYVLGGKKTILAIFSQYWLYLGTKLCPYELISHTYIGENRIDIFRFIEKSFNLGKIGDKKMGVNIVPHKIELFCKVNNLNFQISPNKLDKPFFS